MIKIKNVLRLIIKKGLMVFGIIFMFLLILGFTEQPFWAFYRLSCTGDYNEIVPTKIVMMGADGMPSEKNLIRCYYTSINANKYPNAKIIIALPQLDPQQYDIHLNEIVNELVIRGVDRSRIEFETEGSNTFLQVKNICLKLDPSDSIMVITSPEHMKRTLLCFSKNRFTNIAGVASFGADINPNILHKNSDSIDMIQSLDLRYNIWTQYQYEITVLREYAAILYYKIKGLI
ncbi:MAG: ElyC/SanA/YdcF family protein [Salinivirgaceae bacterium]|nr:ElyC/SanA/YdcF family protein [Salinivirgaceae bacterium]